MAGEPILIVDDTPVNLKLTRILLVNEGYKVLTAGSAEEALELLSSYHPHLVLADIQLPGIDGLEFTRRVKENPALSDIMVVALTAFAMKGDEQKAIDAGCDGYITKPIDTRSLGARLREYLDRRAESHPVSQPPPDEATAKTHIPPVELLALRRKFLEEGYERSRQLLLDLDGRFNAADAARVVHQWIGTGGLLGYSAISRLSREVEASLEERPLDNSQVRESLTNLVLAFSSPREARDAPIPDSVIQGLAGKQIGVAGFPTNERERLCVALERAQATPAFFTLEDDPENPIVSECALLTVFARPENMDSRWLDAAVLKRVNRPVVFAGSRDHLLELAGPLQSLARDFLMDSWAPEEALVRLSMAAAEKPERAGIERIFTGRAQVLVADDDPVVLALVSAAIRNFGMDCRTAADGPMALQTIRETQPSAAVLDVNMPGGMDGYQVLSAIRSERLPVRVLLLTARQQESDVLRGFTLGADDYIVKPFSPTEVVARIKRLLGR
ncbi:MAG TPA: response regulator [Candidatus Sulfopaludibacter sp.]|jgi:CheY-like chemotaxis protein|nr:response regulator [Candidatus Sulfopaludibacter sp.]